MKYLRLFSLLVALTVSALSVSAQDAKADALLKASKNKFNSLKDLNSAITYTLSNPGLDKPIVKNGTLDLSGRKFRVIFPDEEIYCNGTYMWVVVKKDKEVSKTDYDQEDGISVNKVYSIYESKTKSRYDGIEGNIEKVSLFSTDENSDFRLSELWINKTTKLIEKAKLTARNGSTYEYKMTNIKTDTGTNPAIFTCDEAKMKSLGYYVNDLTE